MVIGTVEITVVGVVVLSHISGGSGVESHLQGSSGSQLPFRKPGA